MVARTFKPTATSTSTEPLLLVQPMHPVIEDELLENHEAFLQFLVRRLGDKETAEDVLQQFYLRVVTKGSDLQNASSVTAWLYTVLRRTLIDHYRQETSRRNRESGYVLMQTLTEERWDDEPQGRDCVCLHNVIPTLRPEYSDVLRRVDLGEAPPRKVAIDLGISANNLRVRLHRARQALKQALLTHCGSCAEQNCLECDCSGVANSVAPAEQHLVSAQ